MSSAHTRSIVFIPFVWARAKQNCSTVALNIVFNSLPANPLLGETCSCHFFARVVRIYGYRRHSLVTAAARKPISLFTPHAGLFISQQGHRNVFEAQWAQPKCVGCVNAPLTRIKYLQWFFFFFFWGCGDLTRQLRLPRAADWPASRLPKAPVILILSGADIVQRGRHRVQRERLLRLPQ